MESQENEAQEPSSLTFCSIVKVEEEVKEELEDFDYPFCDPELSDGQEEKPGTSKSADNSQSQGKIIYFVKYLLYGRLL